jgi:hypothetical protein
MKKVSAIIFCISILVAAALLITSYAVQSAPESFAVACALTADQMKARGYIEQVYNYYGENVLAYKNADNTTTIRVFSAPAESSANTITRTVDGGYNGNSDYISTLLPETISSANGIQIGGTGNFINIYPVDDGEYASKQEVTMNAFGQEKSAVVYEDMFSEGMDFYCYPTSFGINSEISLKKYTRKNTFQIKIRLPELVPDTGSPDYILFKTALEKGTVQSILYTPLLSDIRGNWSYANSVRLIEKDSRTNTYTVEYTIDEEFLKDKATKYPIRINQSIHLYKSKQSDTSAYEKTGDEAGHYLSPYMLLGSDTVKGEGWTFIRYETFNNLDIDPEKIVSAGYIFHNLFDLKAEAQISAYAVTADWCSINTRWFNRPAFDDRPVDTIAVRNSGDYGLDLTALVREMLKNKNIKDAKYSVRNSFMIRSDNWGSSIILPSGDNGLFSPYLEIVLKD